MGKAGLQEKHHTALKLLAEGRLSRNEIAKSSGLSVSTLSGLCAGDVAAQGNVALLFKTEFNKITSKQTEDTLKLLKENKALALEKINQRLRSLLPHKTTKDMTQELTAILNALSKAEPHSDISGGVHTHYHLTREERVNEFRRLVAATAKDDRSRIHGNVGRGPSAVIKPTGSRGRGQEAE